jgi:hypothetical protein
MPSRSRKTSSRGAKGGVGGKIMGVVLAGAFLIGFYSIPAHPTTAGFSAAVEARTETVFNWINDLSKSVTGGIDDTDKYLSGDGGSSGGNNGTISGTSRSQVQDAKALAGYNAELISLKSAPAANVAYDRSEWRQWDNITSCWTVREQVLYNDAQKDSALTLLDKNKQRTTDVSKACYITGGTWIDPYTSQKFTNPEDLDIDHLVPLGYVAAHGGQAWSSSKKEDYANAYKEPGHLLAVSASANRSKGDKGPGDWQPSNSAYKCQYAINWINVSTTWKLSVASADKAALKSMLATCHKS